MRVRVVVADDQTVVREGLRSMLGLIPDIDVVAVASTAEESLVLIGRWDPDVWLTDLRMPGMGGVEGIRRLREEGSRTRVVALTTFDDDATIVSALGAGATGFLSKDAGPEAIASAIRAAAEGRSLLDAHAIGALLGRTPSSDTVVPDAGAGLTPREVEVLRLIAGGLSNQQIARRLVVGLATVKTHVNHLLSKTGCRDRAALVTFAFTHRVVDG